MIEKNHRIRALKLTSELWQRFRKNVNPETVRNVIRKAGYSGRAARNNSYTSEVNRRKRLQLKKNMIRRIKLGGMMFFFSDEIKINVLSSSGKVTVWRKKMKS